MSLIGRPPSRFQALPVGAIRPSGWLLGQLRIQANGLTGHLDEFWPDVAESRWIGGEQEGWERAPYWLDGVTPLAFLLDDDRLKEKVGRWMDYILAHQHEDGWMGPREDPHRGSGERVMDPWPLFILLKAITQFHEATNDARVIPAMQRLLQRVRALLNETPLQSWAKMRWPDLLVSIYWLHSRTGEDWLLELAETAARQGYDWEQHFTEFRFRDRQPEWTLENHVVNNAMALKAPAVYTLPQGSRSPADLAKQWIDVLDRFHGQASGVFSGDESLAGRNPSQGTELCAVLEYLFSLEKLIESSGDPSLGDRLEKIAFNAMPATFKPDMWAHQYDQQANQAICRIGEPAVYTNNGPDSNIYGLEPNFGCCTANMHQGWPKLTAHLWMRDSDGGIAAISYAPCIVQLEISGQLVRIEVDTTYPFEETVRCRISTSGAVKFPLSLRIPGWAHGARVTVDGQEAGANPGNFHRIERDWNGETTVILRLPASVSLREGFNGAVSIERGPLVYSLRIGEEWKQVGGEVPHADWEVYPTTPWNYALLLDESDPDSSVQFRSSPVAESPFSPEGAPIRASVHGRSLPGWRLVDHAAAAPPAEPGESIGPLEALELIPYGCTNLRITEFPLLARGGNFSRAMV